MLFSSSRQVALGTYHAAVERWPNAKITPIYKFRARRAASILHPAHPCPHAPGALSLAVWIAVAACGRSIAYF